MLSNKGSINALRELVQKAKENYAISLNIRVRGRKNDPTVIHPSEEGIRQDFKLDLAYNILEKGEGENLGSQLISIMKNHEIIFDGYSAKDLNQYRKLKKWEYYLSDEDKKGICASSRGLQVPESIHKWFYGFKRKDLKDKFLDDLKQQLRNGGYLHSLITEKDANNYLEKVKGNRELLYQVELAQHESALIEGGYIINILSGNPNEFETFNVYWKNQLKRNFRDYPFISDFKVGLYELLRGEGIIDDSLSFNDNRERFNLYKWWEGLGEDKKNVKTRGNTLILPHFFLRSGLSQKKELKNSLVNELNKELVEMGVLLPDYEYIKRSEIEYDSKFLVNKVERKDWFEKLRKQDPMFDGWVLPESFLNVRYPQLFHLCALASLNVNSSSGINNYKTAYSHIAIYLEEQGFPESETLQNILSQSGPDLLRMFKIDYLYPRLDTKELSPKTVNSLISGVNNIFFKLQDIKGFGYDFYKISRVENVKITESHRPYDSSEIESIRLAIQSDYDDIMNRCRRGYVRLDRNSDEYKNNKNTIENQLRIRFEDELNEKITFNGPNTPLYVKRFLDMAARYGISPEELYVSWGLIPRISPDILNVFVMRLSEATGINVDSIVDLDIDDFRKVHPLTGKPCLTFWKGRSTGEKLYHLDIFEGELQWLSKAQSSIVEDIFRDVQELTQYIRGYAHEDDKNKLFICEIVSSKNRVRALSKYPSKGKSIKKFIRKHDIKDKNGKPTVGFMTRFRPTFASRLVEAGVSLREIQFALGHKSMYTTTKYLDQLDLNEKLRKKAYEALMRVHKYALEANDNIKRKNKYRSNKEDIIMQTPLGGCRNIFNPPEFIKNSVLYVEGQACSQYNKCLSCENIMISAIHLPMLFAMQRDYLLLIQTNAVTKTPYGAVVLENLAILDDILNPESSEFNQEELDQAKNDSLFVETAIIDSFGG